MDDLDWSGIIGLIAVAAIFGFGGAEEINNIFQGDEAMDEKINKIKGKILDKIEHLVDEKELALDEYGKVLSLISQISYAPVALYKSIGENGFNVAATPKSEEI